MDLTDKKKSNIEIFYLNFHVVRWETLRQITDESNYYGAAGLPFFCGAWRLFNLIKSLSPNLNNGI